MRDILCDERGNYSVVGSKDQTGGIKLIKVFPQVELNEGGILGRCCRRVSV